LGIEPRSPRPDEANFDIAWQLGSKTFVAEVKSLTDSNEERQLRLGLGQVLRFAHKLGTSAAIPVLILERRPNDSTWEDLCRRVGVILAWPDVFAERLIST
jgi:hypothetical protein